MHIFPTLVVQQDIKILYCELSYHKVVLSETLQKYPSSELVIFMSYQLYAQQMLVQQNLVNCCFNISST